LADRGWRSENHGTGPGLGPGSGDRSCKAKGKRSAADEQGRPSLPARSALNAAFATLDSALCTRFSTPCASDRADRPRSAAGMGSGFSTRSVMVPDPLPVSRQVGLQHEVRHAIASRGEARPRVLAADEQGRSSLPRGKETEGSGSVGRGRSSDPSQPPIQVLASTPHSVIRAPYSALDPPLDLALGEARPRVSAADTTLAHVPA